MSEAVVRGVVVRLATDGDFADLLRRDADAALAGYELTADERAMLMGLCDKERRPESRRPARHRRVAFRT